MAKAAEKAVLPVKEVSSKPSIELHDIDLHKDDPQGLNKIISEVAYELFLKRGATHGNDLGDWLEAEQIVQTKVRSEGKK